MVKVDLMWLDGRDRDHRKRVMTTMAVMMLAGAVVKGSRSEQERGEAL